MKSMRTVDAVGQVLCHDITQIIRGVTKDARFRKGHIIKEEDIPVLLSLGKDHIYVWEKDASMLHENEAAEILRGICQNDGMEPTAVKEGKIELKAAFDGLLKVDIERLNDLNDLEDIMIATRHNNTPVKKGDKLAGTRIIPLVIRKEKMQEAKRIAGAAPDSGFGRDGPVNSDSSYRLQFDEMLCHRHLSWYAKQRSDSFRQCSLPHRLPSRQNRRPRSGQNTVRSL